MKLAGLLVLALAASVVVVGPAHAAACGPSGGARVADAVDQAGDVVFRGHGFGHGMGMSQYGANGAAALGCSHEQILERYYTGAALSRDETGDVVDVGLVDPRHQTRRAVGVQVRNLEPAGGASVAWRIVGCATASRCASQPPNQAPGEAWVVIPDAAGAVAIHRVVNGTRRATPLWTGGQAGATLVVRHDRRVVAVRPTVDGVAVNPRHLRWGQLRITTTGETRDGVATSYVVQRIGPGRDVSGTARYKGVDRYLWGLGEVPSSFELAAQRAQAVAARTFALRRVDRGRDARCRCHVVTTMADQHYTGWSLEQDDLRLGRRWRDSVRTTQREVMTYGGSLIDALYSSSHGGQSESPTYVWGSSDPGYLSPVDDSRWDRATDRTPWPNPYRSWTVGLSWGAVRDRLNAYAAKPSPGSFTRVTDVAVAAPIGSPARGGGVRISGVKSGRAVQEAWTGWAVRQALGLRSPNFLVEVVQDLSRRGTALAGDWNGDGRDDLGWFDGGDIALRLPNGTVRRYRFGTRGDVPVVADFDGDGIDTVSIIRDREWHITNRLRGGGAERTFTYGRMTAGDLPVVGDWDGDGVDSVGIVRRGEWHLRDDVGGGPGQRVFTYGRVLDGDVPIAGDWLGRGRDAVGIVRGAEWHIRYRLAGGPADRVFWYGDANRGDQPVVGDFDGDGDDTAGVARGRTWYLRNDLRGGAAEVTVRFKG